MKDKIWSGLSGRSLVNMMAVIVLLNVAGWGMLSELIHMGADIFGIGVLAYLLGMRHAFDVDHIAAIDNVTRKLRQDGNRPAAVGFFFSLGHSSVVLLLSLGLAVTMRGMAHRLPLLEHFGDVFGIAVSAAFLTIIGLINLNTFVRLWSAFTKGRAKDDKNTRYPMVEARPFAP